MVVVLKVMGVILIGGMLVYVFGVCDGLRMDELYVFLLGFVLRSVIEKCGFLVRCVVKIEFVVLFLIIVICLVFLVIVFFLFL